MKRRQFWKRLMTFMGGLLAVPSVGALHVDNWQGSGKENTRFTWTMEDGRQCSLVKARTFGGGEWKSIGSRDHCIKTYNEWLQHPSVYYVEFEPGDGTETRFEYSDASYERQREFFRQIM